MKDFSCHHKTPACPADKIIWIKGLLMTYY
jgi:hypothetical protein